MRKMTVSRMHERYAQTVLTFRITYVLEKKPVLKRLLTLIILFHNVVEFIQKNRSVQQDGTVLYLVL